MKRDYDQTIEEHYIKVAEESGLLSTSTMADVITRERETGAIVQFVEESLGLPRPGGIFAPATIMDVGCGNGYTLSVLAARCPAHRFIGIEPSDALRSLAASRFEGNDQVSVVQGDIRDCEFAGTISADILICQRVLINLLDVKDQQIALDNIVSAVRSPGPDRAGGTLAFIEAFASPLTRLNEARAEFELPPIPPAHHNLYLADGFFDIPQLKPIVGAGPLASNMLSTHYYVARVLHPSLTRDHGFKRNSEFVKFFFAALKPDAGDYSPLKLHMFEKIGPA